MFLTSVHKLFLTQRGWIVPDLSSLGTWRIFPGSWMNPKTHASDFWKLKNWKVTDFVKHLRVTESELITEKDSITYENITK